jgi:osmotically-inducible protein OsmY
VKTALLLEKNVRSLNYTVQTIDRVVYVMGYTTDSADLDRAMNAIRHVDGVKEVVNYVDVKQSG